MKKKRFLNGLLKKWFGASKSNKWKNQNKLKWAEKGMGLGEGSVQQQRFRCLIFSDFLSLRKVAIIHFGRKN